MQAQDPSLPRIWRKENNGDYTSGKVWRSSSSYHEVLLKPSYTSRWTGLGLKATNINRAHLQTDQICIHLKVRFTSKPSGRMMWGSGKQEGHFGGAPAAVFFSLCWRLWDKVHFTPISQGVTHGCRWIRHIKGTDIYGCVECRTWRMYTLRVLLWLAVRCQSCRMKPLF